MSKSNRKNRKRKKIVGKFRSDLSRLGLPEPARFVHNPRGQVKMSEVLMAFIEPYAARARTEEDYHKLLSVALVAWNAALIHPDDRQEMIDKVIDRTIPPPVTKDAKLIIHDLIRRKDRYFREIKRGILAYDLTMTKDGPHVFVASTL